MLCAVESSCCEFPAVEAFVLAALVESPDPSAVDALESTVLDVAVLTAEIALLLVATFEDRLLLFPGLSNALAMV